MNVGLTGGVASGKSSVSEQMGALGIEVVDTDVIAREVVARNSAGLDRLLACFGRSILDAQGNLDRRAMRERVFADASAKHQLESVLHPLIRERAIELTGAARGPLVLIVVPLLAESKHYDWVDRVLVVDVEAEVQRRRLLSRDGVTLELAEAMIASQASRLTRLSMADDVILNSGSLSELIAQCAVTHRRLLRLAQRRAMGLVRQMR